MNSNETFDIQDGLRIVRRNFFLCCACIVLCAGIAVLLAFNLPKRFKSAATLNIQTSYFQNPMVDGLITQVSDPQELQAQRMSLLRMAIDSNYLDSLAEQYHQYSDEAKHDAKIRAKERDFFSKRIEYYSLNSNTFELVVYAPDAELAQAMARSVLDHTKSVLIAERSSNLDRTKQAIQNHVRILGDNIRKIDTPTGSAAIEDELRRVEGTLSGMLMKFTDSHPEVVKLRRQQQQLAYQVKASGARAAKVSPSDDVMARGGALAKEPSKEVYNELLKKLNYLSIVLDMEKDRENVSYLGVIEYPNLPAWAIFPNKKLFLAVGVVVGILLASILTLIAELGRRSILAPHQVADILEVPLLGEMPILVTQGAEIVPLPPSRRPTVELPAPAS